MAPKQTAAAKQASILAWFQKSRVAHCIKDLEKALPSIGSINTMQVKDYLQALSDDNQIRVEKIGSGNWYWSFPGEEKKAKEALLGKVREERDKAVAAMEQLQKKVDDAGTAREGGDDMLLATGNDRKSLLAKHTDLSKELENLEQELAGYSDHDPVEVDKRRQEVAKYKAEATKWTEQIQSLEDWLKQHMGGNKEQMINIMRTYYGEEFDEEEACLRELHL